MLVLPPSSLLALCLCLPPSSASVPKSGGMVLGDSKENLDGHQLGYVYHEGCREFKTLGENDRSIMFTGGWFLLPLRTRSGKVFPPKKKFVVARLGELLLILVW